jgi:RNA polymerase sigma factor (TIGR02999 family)
MASLPDITTLLDDWSRENHRALEQLLPLVYEELRYVARRQLRRERAGHTLQPTALVHEAYLRLVDQRQVSWRSRAHFFGVAAQVMRRILVDDARRHNAAKWGDGIQRVPIDDAIETPGRDEISVRSTTRSAGSKLLIGAWRESSNSAHSVDARSKKRRTC